MYARGARSIFARGTQILTYLNIFFFVLFRSHFTCEYRLPIGKYRAVRHIDCAFGANIDLLIVPSSTVAATTVPLPHKDCFAIGGRLAWVRVAARRAAVKARQSRAGESVGMCVKKNAERRSPDSFVTPKACHLSRYRESLPHKDCFAIGGRLAWVCFADASGLL